VRVSVYAGDLNQVNRGASANVRSLGGSRNELPRAARQVAVPFSSAAAPATVDLFYEMNNANGHLRPGEKVSVAVPLQGETESSVVPAAAVLYDIRGGKWVYENTGPQTFTGRRVEIRFVSHGDAVLARGPKPGVKVVTAGAAELFGTEFGIGK
jgi:multidrug efflux pump subunit AcrA (membrane-fusion protein)